LFASMWVLLLGRSPLIARTAPAAGGYRHGSGEQGSLFRKLGSFSLGRGAQEVMRQDRAVRLVIAGIATITLIATACAPTGQPSTTATAAASEQPVAGGRLVIGATGDPKTMQPVISGDTTSSLIWQQVYVTLTRPNYKTGQTEPNLAEKFELSADGLTLTFTLRDNLVWSNGDPFIGEDWKYTVEAVGRSKKTVRKSTYQDIVGW